MRRTLQSVVTTGLALGALVPAMAMAQARPANRGPGGGQPWQCNPTDSLRAFNRGLRADSLARDRASGGQVPGASVTGGTARSHEYPEYDVVLDIPNVCVERIFLKVDSVTAKLNLHAQIANLVKVDAGADVLIGNVDLTIQDVRASALLLVDLDDVVHIVDQTLTFIDNHPEIVQQLGSTLQNTVGTVGSTVGGLVRALVIGTTRLANGNTLQRIVDQATGSLVERTLSTAGQIIADKTVGNILNLP